MGTENAFADDITTSEFAVLLVERSEDLGDDELARELALLGSASARCSTSEKRLRNALIDVSQKVTETSRAIVKEQESRPPPPRSAAPKLS